MVVAFGIFGFLAFGNTITSPSVIIQELNEIKGAVPWEEVATCEVLLEGASWFNQAAVDSTLNHEWCVT